MRDEALTRAIKAAGGVNALARKLNITSASVAQWEKAPDRRVLAIEDASGGKVRRWHLRPDLYPAPKKRAKPEARV